VVNDAASECESLDAEVVAVTEVVTKENKRLSTPGRRRRPTAFYFRERG
jgi:hypothetical protein